jgi:PAS domain S-box-containing protein
MDNHAIVIADAQGVIQLWSRGAETLFGHAARSVVGQPLECIVPDEYREVHRQCFARAMESGVAGGEGQAFELPVGCAGGVSVFPGMFVLVRDASKTVIGAMAIFTAPKSIGSQVPAT